MNGLVFLPATSGKMVDEGATFRTAAISGPEQLVGDLVDPLAVSRCVGKCLEGLGVLPIGI
ncbi:hypothetical protein DPMN_151006 [Dreissena polymorpha]|uniref:Uncharacterized protein n=1 Tax=Dreissena polymorpha TaxID=45954 RepID=A0A9D4FET0_DREPO|nr:hypothetical protein DPMN_151006 [Dreissena polymorpha]